MSPPQAQLQALPKIRAEAVPEDVDLIVLFGSRAKGIQTPTSDWDLGITFRQTLDHPLRLFELDALLSPLVGCSSDAIDLVDLEHSSYLLQRVVTEEGRLLFERRPGLFFSFCSRAIRQWADWCRREQKLSSERELIQT
ncbi:MAG: nucleotidyltransferase domain-containing protein [Cyanobacteria bacterium K_DeepCast_35m_m1_288]|nr:nucleotidyltransferase domain-containing protein [Cyanobacteria bacterium K_DeepCast_35m_m1_288]